MPGDVLTAAFIVKETISEIALEAQHDHTILSST